MFTHDGEQFRHVPGWSNYAVSRTGAVVRLGPRRVWRPVKPRRVSNYWKITLSQDGRKLFTGVHRLVLLAWVGPPPPGHQAAHANDVGTDNRLENLSWKTIGENNIDAIRNGFRGPDRGCTKLTEADVREIRHTAATTNTTAAELASQYGVRIETIRGIVARRTWAWLD